MQSTHDTAPLAAGPTATQPTDRFPRPTNAAELQIFYHGGQRLRLTVPGSHSYLAVRPSWSAPLSHPGKYLALLDGAGKEIITLRDPDVLSPESRQAVDQELRLRYLTPVITGVDHARQEYGVTYWTVQTDRGAREFVTQNLQENAIWIADNHLLLLDVDGNRFEIPDVHALDKHSHQRLFEIL